MALFPVFLRHLTGSSEQIQDYLNLCSRFSCRNSQRAPPESNHKLCRL